MGLSDLSFYYKYLSVLIFSLILSGILIVLKRKINIKSNILLKKYAPYLCFFLGFIAYTLLSLIKHQYFNSYAFDLGIFDQALWNYSNFKTPFSTIRDINILGDHFDPTLALLTPLYWVWSDVRMLLLFQIFMVVFGSIAIYKIAKLKTDNALFSIALMFSFIFFRGIAEAINFDFHTSIVGAMLFPWLFYFIIIKKWKLFFLIFILTLGCKETLAVFTTVLGIYMILFERERKRGFIVLIISLFWFILTTKIIIPYFSGDKYFHWSYDQLGKNPWEALSTIIFHPFYVLKIFFSPREKIKTLLVYLSSVNYLSIFNPATFLLVLPGFAQKFFSSRPDLWTREYHHGAELAFPIYLSAIYGANNLTTFLNRKLKIVKGNIITFLGISILISTVIFNFYNLPLKKMITLDFYQPPFYYKNVQEAITLIPKNAKVSAFNTIAPHLSQRKIIVPFPNIKGAEYIILNENDPNQWPIDAKLLKKYIEDLKQNKFEGKSYDFDLIYEKNGVYLFRKTK